MTATQRRYDRATRVQTFGRDNAADFAAGSKALTLFTSLDGLMVKTDAAKADQSPNRVSKETLLDGMMLDLKNIARTARDIEKTDNGFAAPYRIPLPLARQFLQICATSQAESLAGEVVAAPMRHAALACIDDFPGIEGRRHEFDSFISRYTGDEL